MDRLFDPMSIVFEQDARRKLFVTFSGTKRASRLEISKREQKWLLDLLNANPGNELDVFISFVAMRQGKAEISYAADGSMSVTLTDSVSP
ncbi:hypothetical protein X759_14155 [Mesorhizobium sp. LSHC420B00]|nr:hypothetical protein X759_14155 [Mesorhizobium sp. LSHC420B00]